VGGVPPHGEGSSCCFLVADLHAVSDLPVVLVLVVSGIEGLDGLAGVVGLRCPARRVERRAGILLDQGQRSQPQLVLANVRLLRQVDAAGVQERVDD
jgi:hypothetical protein